MTNPKRHPLRLLILEDNPNDVEIVLYALRNAGYDPDAVVVSSREEFSSNVNNSFDAILSDYTLPQFSAPDALAMVKERHIDVPFIVISGTIGEELAVAMMRNGADDYLLKDRLSRIGPSLEIAMKSRELRRRAAVTEEELKKMMRAVEQSADSIIVTNKDGIIEYANPAFLHISGFSRGEVIGSTPAILKSGRHDSAFYERLWNTITSGKIFRAEFINKNKNGEEYYEVQGISPVYDDQGHLTNFVSTGKDMTSQRRAEEALRHSVERYRNLVENARDAIFTLSGEGVLTSLNPAFEKITGWKREDWIGKYFQEILHDGDRARAKEFFRVVMGGTMIPVKEYRVLKADGSFVVVEILTAPKYLDGTIEGILGIARDVTERQLLERQIRQAQKMESIGTLAGGIAHDFNNILGIILTCSSLLDREPPGSKQFHSTIEIVQRTVQRGANLVRQILTFARKDEILYSSVRLNDIIVELVKMLQLTMPKTIDISMQLDPSLPPIIGDANQVHQAIMNLCINARDAILEKEQGVAGVGTIHIETARIHRSALLRKFHHVEAEEYLVVRISDTGTGMDEETKRRIFDPFFTTKEKGKGTGLGLAVVYGVMQGQHGFVDVESTRGEGTTFTLYFPLVNKEADVPVTVDDTPTEFRGGTETILFIEDEEFLLEMMKLTLEENGYTVCTAVNGQQGVDLFYQHRNEISLVFTDFGLPSLDGYSVLEKIKEIRPDIKMLLSSGYLEPFQRTLLHELGVTEIVQKPYEASLILTKIRFLLDQK